jgi:hypothetical protein
MNCPKCGAINPEPGENAAFHVDPQYRICLFCDCKWSVWQQAKINLLKMKIESMEAYNAGWRKGYHERKLVDVKVDSPYVIAGLNYQYGLGNEIGYNIAMSAAEKTNRLQDAEKVLKFIVTHSHCMNSSVNESCTLGIDDPEEWCLYCKAHEYFKKP